jgi:hypothetical protein
VLGVLLRAGAFESAPPSAKRHGASSGLGKLPCGGKGTAQSSNAEALAAPKAKVAVVARWPWAPCTWNTK